MRIVLDTNVLVSGLLSPYGPPGIIVDLVLNGDLTLCYDLRILQEYEDVLLRPTFSFPPARVREVIEFAKSFGSSITAGPLVEVSPDPDDAAFMEVAVAAEVNYLINGNIRHFPFRIAGAVRIASPVEFLRLWKKRHEH